MKKLRDIVENAGRTAVLIGSLAYVGGCETTPRGQVFGENLMGALLVEEFKAERNPYSRPQQNNYSGEQKVLTEADQKRIVDEAVNWEKRKAVIHDRYARKLAENPQEWANRLTPEKNPDIWKRALEYNPEIVNYLPKN